jgi:hypothetical protein
MGQISRNIRFSRLLCLLVLQNPTKNLKEGGFAGLVASKHYPNQNNSREGSLGYIINNGGVIFNAIHHNLGQVTQSFCYYC